MSLCYISMQDRIKFNNCMECDCPTKDCDDCKYDIEDFDVWFALSDDEELIKYG